MAEGTYEYECMRAELLGIEKPNEEEFEKARTERLKREEEEQEAAEAELLEQQEESLKNAGGKLDELNTILSHTQQKLHRFKQTACTSFSSMFGRGSVDLGDPTKAAAGDAENAGPSTSATASRRNTTASGSGAEIAKMQQSSRDGDLNSALDNLEEMQANESDDVKSRIPTEKIRAAKLDIQNKMTSHLGKLDALIGKAEKAEISMSEQTKEMRKMAK